MRKRTKRKARPLINTVSFVIEGVTTTPDKELDQIRTIELAAIDTFARGVATEQEWHDINGMTGICHILASQGIGHEAAEACDRAYAALQADWRRYEQTKKMGTTGPGLQAYRDVFAYYDLQRQSISRAEYERHLRYVINKIKSSKPRAASPL